MTQIQSAESIDYLTRLPVELFQHILELVEQPADYHVYLGLVSKAFLPFARSRTFAGVLLRNPRRLAQLVDTVRQSSEAGEHTVALTLAFVAEGDDGIPSDASILRLFTHLPNLTTLTLCNSKRIADAILADTSTKRLFPALRTLSLEDWIDPFDVVRFCNLGRHPKLSRLDLFFPPSTRSVEPHTSEVGAAASPPSRSWSLTLNGAVLNEEAPLALVRSLSTVRSLYLYERDGHVESLPSFLCQLSQPSRLRILALSLPAPLPAFYTLSTVLATFQNLRRLTFGANSFDTSLVTAVRAFEHLRILTFHRNSRLSSLDLKLILAPGLVLSALASLILDNLFSSTECDKGRYIDKLDWTDAFVERDMEEIRELARERNVKVEGIVGMVVKLERTRAAKEEKQKREQEEQ